MMPGKLGRDRPVWVVVRASLRARRKLRAVVKVGCCYPAGRYIPEIQYTRRTIVDIAGAKAHHPKLVRTAQVRQLMHGDHPTARANAWLGLRITKGVGSMWCAYAFAAIALISLPAALSSGDLIIIVSWVAQTFIQLVLLPVIIVGQNVQAAASDARAEADHETLTAVHALTVAVHEINEQQSLILERLDTRG
jgi:hypothetical protein